MLLRYKFVAGEVVPYRFKQKQYWAARGAPGKEEEVECSVRMRVLAVDENFHLVTTMQTELFKRNGEELPVPKHPTVAYLEMDPCGKMVAFTDPSMMLFLLATEDISPGEKWEVRRTMVPGNRITPTEVVDRYTLQAIKDGVAHIAYHFDELTYEGDRPETANQKWSIRARGAFRFNAEAGRLLGMHTESMTTVTVGENANQLSTLRDLQLLS
ncbi:MAG: hypothetical protein ACYCW6_28005 [Candidatus Xenobia bacterium]